MHPRLRIIAVVAPATAVAVALAMTACFDFGATMAGGPPDDGGSPSGLDAAFADAQDAGSPAAEAGSDGGGFCASLSRVALDGGRLVLCDDFDEPASLPGPYFDVEGEIGGVLAEVEGGLSPPSALAETTTPLDDGGLINVALRDAPIAPPTLTATMTFAFSLEPVQIDTAPNAAIVLGAVDFFDAAGDRYSLGLAINVVSGQPALALDEQSGFADGGSSILAHALPANGAPPMNQWSTVALTIDWTSATTGTASVTVNGAVELAPFALTMTVAATSLQVGIGTAYVTQPAPAWELLYDNVWFAVQ
jgi:hypothetical protein